MDMRVFVTVFRFGCKSSPVLVQGDRLITRQRCPAVNQFQFPRAHLAAAFPPFAGGRMFGAVDESLFPDVRHGIRAIVLHVAGRLTHSFPPSCGIRKGGRSMRVSRAYPPLVDLFVMRGCPFSGCVSRGSAVMSL